MGCDIHGWIEVRMFKDWYPAINIGYIVDRNYDMFGCLFGVRNYANFRPIAEKRGIPDDVSDIVKREIDRWDYEAHSHSWILYEEVDNIDWEEESEGVDQRIHEYRKLHDGKLEYTCKFSSTSELTKEDYQKLAESGKLEKDEIVYKYEKVKRKDTLSGDWKFIFECMKYLSKDYGKENVRMVVWFDN